MFLLFLLDRSNPPNRFLQKKKKNPPNNVMSYFDYKIREWDPLSLLAWRLILMHSNCGVETHEESYFCLDGFDCGAEPLKRWSLWSLTSNTKYWITPLQNHSSQPGPLDYCPFDFLKLDLLLHYFSRWFISHIFK